VAPPPIFPPVQPVPAATTDSREHSQQQVNAGHRAQLPALIATLPSPDREIALLGVVAGVSIPDIVATLAVTPAAVHRALSALQPAATTNGSPPAARQRIVLLPHARTASADGIVRLAARVLGRLVTWWRSMGWWDATPSSLYKGHRFPAEMGLLHRRKQTRFSGCAASIRWRE
jgi:hypothetical protein